MALTSLFIHPLSQNINQRWWGILCYLHCQHTGEVLPALTGIESFFKNESYQLIHKGTGWVFIFYKRLTKWKRFYFVIQSICQHVNSMPTFLRHWLNGVLDWLGGSSRENFFQAWWYAPKKTLRQAHWMAYWCGQLWSDGAAGDLQFPFEFKCVFVCRIA